MAQLVFGSREAQAILVKDRVLREETAREAMLADARRAGRLSTWEVFIEEDPPPERSVIVEGFDPEEARVIAEREHLGYNELISGVVILKSGR